MKKENNEENFKDREEKAKKVIREIWDEAIKNGGKK